MYRWNLIFLHIHKEKCNEVWEFKLHVTRLLQSVESLNPFMTVAVII